MRRPGKTFLRLFGVSKLGDVETPVYRDLKRKSGAVTVRQILGVFEVFLFFFCEKT